MSIVEGVFISTLVSVVMPFYNAENTIRTVVDSVIAQIYPIWELIIIDDASFYKTNFFLQDLAERDNRIHVLYNKKNLETAASRNRGVLEAKGEYIAFLDADDAWLPNKLAIQMEFMRTHKAIISCTAYHFFDKNGCIKGRSIIPPETTTYKQLLRGNILGCSTVMVLANVMKKNLFPANVFH